MVLFKRLPIINHEGNLFSTQKITYKLLFILPMYTYEQEHNFIYWIKVGIFHFMSICTMLAPLHMVVVIMKTVYDMDKSDLTVVTGFALEAAWFQFSFMGLSYMCYRRKDLEIMLKFANEHFKWRSARGATYVDISKSFTLTKTFTIVWSCIPAFAVTYAFIDVSFLQGGIKLNVDCWYPVDTTKPINLAIILLLQFYSKIAMVTSFTAGSTLYVSLILQCCSQYDCIFCSLKNIFYTSGIFSIRDQQIANDSNEEDHKAEYFNSKELRESYDDFNSNKKTKSFGRALLMNSTRNKCNISKHQQAETDVTNSDVTNSNSVIATHTAIAHAAVGDNEISYNGHIKEFRAALKSCVDQQNHIVHLCNLMEDFFHPFTFLRLAEMTLQLCFLAYVVAFATTMTTSDYITTLAFIILTLFELFILTYPAEILSHQSMAMGAALMRTPWHLVMRPFRNDFCIMLAFAKRPTKLTALKVFTLNADRFRVVVGTAFSYFTLMSSFNK